MAIAEQPPLRSRSAPAIAAQERTTTAVTAWAAFGAMALAFIAFVLIKWVTGPYFKTVPSGPSEPPTWMEIALTTWQIAGVFVAVAFLYWFVIRPWRRDGRPSTDGLLLIACFILYFQDPLGNYFNHWFAYNTTLIQFGSWVNEIPGWMSYGEPGAMLSEPLVFTGAFYIWAFFGLAVIGSWVMRKAKARWPRLGALGLLGITFAVMVLADLVLEGLIMMPLGAYHYAGAHEPMIFAGRYHQFPVWEAILAGALFTGLAALRYFRNDRGETVAERGLDKLSVSQRRKTLLRFLALVGATQAIMLASYNIPAAMFLGAHTAAWPESIQKRSYFTNYLCGAGTDRMCPGPGVPNDRGSDGAHLSPTGDLVIPPAARLPRGPVPFDGGTPGGGR